MYKNLCVFICVTLVVTGGGIVLAATSGNPDNYPSGLVTGVPPDEPPFTVEPTDSPTDQPTLTIEPTRIGGDTGWISVDSNPQGAFVEFDGVGEGTTPISIPVKTTSDPSHRIRITMSGYQEWTGHVTGNPGPGETLYQTADLVQIPPTITVEPTTVGGDVGWFQIDSAPQGADVTFDGTYYGTSPILVKVLVTGTPSHDFRVRMNGYRDYTQHLSNNPGPSETIPLFASLVPLAQYGSISVTSDPSGALATLDSGQQYLTPCTFPQVVSGMHTVTVSKAGYAPYTSQVQVTYNSQPGVFAPLTKIQTTGTLFIDSVPQGADIQVDNLWQGQTPQRIGNLVGGYHSVMLRLSGYQTLSQQVMITTGQDTRISPTLVKNPPEVKTGSISVSCNPAGASVYLNNDFQGVVPEGGYLDIPDLTPGVYTIVLKDPQMEDYSASIPVIAGQITPVNVTLKAPAIPSGVNGTLLVSSSPAGAQIFLNNQFVGITPVTLSAVAPGEYALILKMDGYSDYSNRVQIGAGLSTTAVINLTPVVSAPSQVPTQPPVPVPTETRSPLPFTLIPAALAAALILIRRGQ